MLLAAAGLVAGGCATTGMHTDETVERGWIDRTIFDRPAHHGFRDGFDTVHVIPPVASLVGRMTDSVDYFVFLGTWCGDSKREVPRFLKLADSASIAADRIHLYALDRTKTSKDGVSERFRVERLPTFVLMKNGRELGRIVETPKLSVEEDILNILVQDRANP